MNINEEMYQEAEGVLIDLKAGKQYDDICRETLKRCVCMIQEDCPICGEKECANWFLESHKEYNDLLGSYCNECFSIFASAIQTNINKFIEINRKNHNLGFDDWTTVDYLNHFHYNSRGSTEGDYDQ